jgi:hypothetical protein
MEHYHSLKDVDTRRVAVLNEITSLVEEKAVVSEEISAAMMSYQTGRGGRSPEWRSQRQKRLNEIKRNILDCNAELAELKVAAKQIAKREAEGDIISTYARRAASEMRERCAREVEGCIQTWPTMDGSVRHRNPSSARDLQQAAERIRALPLEEAKEADRG